ncbi:putative retrotransposon hot spot protein (RHS,) [Trypanosoma cruzi]|uniref:Putative retrotransposon hot spot protein (RHS,) n=1 Tax=Trypanosoma cruzi TaxID=5693 RepID=A0A2V2UR87_TRYCR|nr:putative retrotransposon hot spot protein (RHS,) [Trypanosoma cruzi]
MLHRTGVVVAPRRGSCDGSDAAARRGVEETRRPEWALDSRLDEVLLEEKERITNMRLNDFLRNHFDSRGVEEFNENVYMKDFLGGPNEFIKDEVLLSTIEASPYQELKKEREEFYMPLEASNKLGDECAFNISQWRELKKKDTVIPLARVQISTACSQVLRDERWKAEERERRERQELGIDVSTWIKYAVFKGGVRFMDMQLNDFLTMELDGKGTLGANRDLLLEEFFKDPKKYIEDAEYWAKYRHRIVTRGWRGLYGMKWIWKRMYAGFTRKVWKIY